ncbi:MAG TPA: YceI family protein [Solirubrobacteraceae bacterium]
MVIPAGTYTLGPEVATLTVKTGKTGAASKAGHNLVIEVAVWSATLTAGDDPASTAIELTADARSLHVVEGSGGITALSDEDKANIRTSIDDEVLEGLPIAFRSTAVSAGDAPGRLHVEGDLELHGAHHPVAFDLDAGADGTLTSRAVVRQSDWGMKPYSTLFGTLKVVDEVEVLVSAKLGKG